MHPDDPLHQEKKERMRVIVYQDDCLQQHSYSLINTAELTKGRELCYATQRMRVIHPAGYLVAFYLKRKDRFE
eukprot:1141262-Pelagomonas_calceolata.AAC.10